MLFSDPIFLFCFLPIVLTLHSLLPTQWRNIVLLAASLFFYAWGEGAHMLVMLVSIGINYRLGVKLAAAGNERSRRFLMKLAIAFNLGMLVVFKYTNFLFVSAVGACGIELAEKYTPSIHLPIGISFFTFQALSYVIDVYRRQVEPQQRLGDLALYIASFPQLIAGPIVRYSDVQKQIAKRIVNFHQFRHGIERFIVGLGKKMIIANAAAEIADAAFALNAHQLSSGDAWIGAFAYAIQIYFDFSGYSDMAIGIGLMLGFRFAENFNYPYIAMSVTEFWRRWHISLSTWFRDYLYIPLGGNRQGQVRTYVNLMIVFLLCGLWHGASWTFVLWGALHGMFLIVERIGFSRVLNRLGLLAHTYTMLTVLFAWVLFRADTVSQAAAFMQAMLGVAGNWQLHHSVNLVMTRYHVTVLCIAVAAATPIGPLAVDRLRQLIEKKPRLGEVLRPTFELTQLAGISLQFAWCVCLVFSSTYNPFIYFRF
ncbi:MAG: MBOAT family protein [Planctomycetales bacterium]|nr:MBOAT family protein [Planctomycetales bacterium]